LQTLLLLQVVILEETLQPEVGTHSLVEEEAILVGEAVILLEEGEIHFQEGEADLLVQEGVVIHLEEEVILWVEEEILFQGVDNSLVVSPHSLQDPHQAEEGMGLQEQEEGFSMPTGQVTMGTSGILENTYITGLTSPLSKPN